jgi:Domain of unknown function (DUF4291)
MTTRNPSSLAATGAPLLAFERHPILATFDDDTVTVYQAYNPAIAKWAVEHQALGGPEFSFERMSWIKPGFLWMMYRSGWASKRNQERVLAIQITRAFFDRCLRHAELTSYHESSGVDRDTWKSHQTASDATIQWDPDHDIKGRTMKRRRAIQIGLRRGEVLRAYAQDAIVHVQDITDHVHEMKALVDQGRDVSDMLPVERPYIPGRFDS